MSARSLFLLLWGLSLPAWGGEFVSVAEPAILYDANSLKAKKLFVATRYLPMEQIVVLANWVKVRDHTGRMYWIEKRRVSNRRFVMVSVAKSQVRSRPDRGGEVVFNATQQLGLEWLENAGAWVRVRHQDGATGFIPAGDVWGD